MEMKNKIYKITIFGRSNCIFCFKAKKLAEKLKHTYKNFDYNYIDVKLKKINMEFLCKKTKKKVKTIPQIFIDNQHIGGYIDFKIHIKKMLK